ncbi:MAG: hypothetical protein ACTSVB_02220, partial [Candidatus Heimdallarchaeaceae archaeon]
MKIQTENDIRGEFFNPIMDKFNKKTHLKWILSHLFAHKKLVFSFLLFSTMSALIAAIIPVLTG